MSLEVVGKVTQEDASGYDQIQLGAVISGGTSSKNSSGTQESRSDRNLKSVSSSARTSANKTHIAFGLSFTIKIANRTPFNPQSNC